jgi:hypothetical protein
MSQSLRIFCRLRGRIGPFLAAVVVAFFAASLAYGADPGTTGAAKPIAAQVTLDAPASAANIFHFASSAVSIQLLAANPNRIGAVIVNTSANKLCIKYGATADPAASFTYIIAPNGEWIMPHRYTGRIDGIWAAADAGVAQVTELLP